MKFNILTLSALFLGGAIASPLAGPAADPPVEIAIRKAGTALEKLNADFQQWGTPGSYDEGRWKTEHALTITREVTDALRAGSRDVRRGPAITGNEAVKLLNWSESLTNYLQLGAKGWIGAKNVAVAVGAKDVIREELLNLSDAAIVFQDAITSKLPATAQSPGLIFKSRQTSALESAIREYRR
ncbi:hypothetical protein BT63DRAFT_454126 [Microthyrium microscopicum]|uniref:Uncharacterized protein n=1 Tax=Microthyrium microscopicum TaxID=703497 RepID=A0A6A6UCG7_9PEZI|nr:hypothetical protein BT63DRAFT_454126 [Microthyrium microscopicum]